MWSDFAEAKIEEFHRLGPSSAQLLRLREWDRARAEVAGLARLPAPVRVPCHHDYTPRNWLMHNDALYVIDFEWAGVDAWVADLACLHLGIWPSRPDLQEAFLNGYGRTLSVTDRNTLRGCAVLTAVWLLVKAHETCQPSFEDASRTALRHLIRSAA